MKQLHGEIDRAHLSPRFWNFRPDEHPGLRLFDVPANSGQPVDQCVASDLIFLCNRFDSRLTVSQGDDRRNLTRLENTVIVIAFDCGERTDHLAVSRAESDSPARHAESLAHRGHFDPNVDGAG